MTDRPHKRLTQRADAAQRAQRGWALRVAGATWQQIAEVTGYTDEDNARRAVRNYFGTLPQPDHDELRAVWRARHERLWRQSQKAVADGQPGALRAGVAVARSASQLDGLDAPQRLELYRPDSEEFAATMAELRALVRQGEIEGDIFEDEVEGS